MVRHSLRSKLFIAIAALIVLAAATHTLWLTWVGGALVRDDDPSRADLAVVLAGDYYGHRIERAAELVKAGYVPAVLVSGPPYYAVHECDLAIDMMVRKGYPAAWFIAAPNNGLSTREEAAYLLGNMRRRSVRNFLLVTSTYHTRRAARTYRSVERQIGGPPFRTVGAPDEHFRPDSWWRDREGRKIVFFEWCKTAASVLGM